MARRVLGDAPPVGRDLRTILERDVEPFVRKAAAIAKAGEWGAEIRIKEGIELFDGLEASLKRQPCGAQVEPEQSDAEVWREEARTKPELSDAEARREEVQ